MKSRDPIDNIVWVPSRDLKANHYNPNVVMNQELKLLELSIVENGWIQPILINGNNIIIDGYHRWMLSMESKDLRNIYAEEVPCAVLDIDDSEAIMMTVRINRAKGSHASLRMSDLVKELIDVHGVDHKDIVQKMGATPTEVELLYDGSLFKEKDLKNYRYSKAWVPVEVPAE
jgi:ParB-like chromosome segregation protein Spo0J